MQSTPPTAPTPQATPPNPAPAASRLARPRPLSQSQYIDTLSKIIDQARQQHGEL